MSRGKRKTTNKQSRVRYWQARRWYTNKLARIRRSSGPTAATAYEQEYKTMTVRPRAGKLPKKTH